MERVRLSDLYSAYKKAKSDAYFERGHFHAIAFADYESDLDKNLRALQARLESSAWWHDIGFLGEYTYIPKGIDQPRRTDGRDIHFATLDPIEDWRRACAEAKAPLKAKFRPVICPSVDYQIVSALWIVKVGHKFDEKLDRDRVYAHRIKRVGDKGRVNEQAYQLFSPYFSGYRSWRSNGLKAIRSALEEKRSVIAVTMDVRNFYHSVSPRFLLRKGFLEALGVNLTEEEHEFTRVFVESIAMWHASTPEYLTRPEGALPVGLSASRVISNVLLAEFDKVAAGNASTIHYGRYADDIFLVTKSDDSIRSGDDFIKWLRQQLDGYLVLDKDGNDVGLKLKLPYAKDSDIVFSSRKQKIFFLSGDHGLDLVGQIEEQIRKQSSEHRLLPELPEGESEMLGHALLATPDARLEADALRKAEAVSLRRLGFSFLLGDFEAYARDLDPSDGDWEAARKRFYGIVERYVVTPVGFFDYFSYIVRVFGLMVACRDFESAKSLLRCVDSVYTVLGETVSMSAAVKRQFSRARQSYYRGFLQAALESGTVANFELSSGYRKFVGKLAEEARPGRATLKVPETVRSLLLSDLGRRSYQEYWYSEYPDHGDQPRVPRVAWIRAALETIEGFAASAKKTLSKPYWPPIAFPTRPPAVWQLSLSVPKALGTPGGIERLLKAVRGGYVRPDLRDFTFVRADEGGRKLLRIPNEETLKISVAVPSFEATEGQWTAAVDGAPDHSLKRYLAVRRLINQIISSSTPLHYVVFPELSLPYWWALDIASRLAKSGISLIAGVETRGGPREYRNDVLVSLVTSYYGRRSNICFVQQKIALSHEEAHNVKAHGKKFSPARGAEVDERRPLYVHGGLAFGVLICSDLTTIQNRAHFQGAVDALFVVEWNKDIDTFGLLVESASHDLHAAIVQVNNRAYGDSRVRMPFALPYKRDVVKVKGGDADFFVSCTLDIGELRSFQSKPMRIEQPKKPKKKVKEKVFKPTPIGFKVSDFRKGH